MIWVTKYPSGIIENILLDIFQDYELNVNRIIVEIEKISKMIIFIEINKNYRRRWIGIKYKY